MTRRGDSRPAGCGGRARPARRPAAFALGLLAAGTVASAAEAPPRQVAAEAEAAASAAPIAAPPAQPADPTAAARIVDEAERAALSTACDDAAFLLAAGRAREALGLLEAALLAAGAAADPATATRARALLATARAAEQSEDGAASAADREDSAQAARERSSLAGSAATSLRAERLARARDLHARGQRELALAHLRALLRDLPGDAEVDDYFRALLDETHTRRSAAIAERQRELRSEIALQVERSLIPEGFDGRPIHPSDWHERRAGRRSALDVADAEPAWRTAIADRLAGRVTVGFDATPLSEAIEVVARLGGINLVAAPELIAATDRLVTLRAVGMRLEDVVTWIAEQAGTRWSLANGAVYLGDAVRGQPTVALHDIGELLVGAQDHPGMRLDLSTGDGAGAGAGFLMAEEAAPAPTADDVADLIRRTISPTTWEDGASAIAVRGSSLLITAPPEIQRLIREFLRAQSAQRSLAVRVDARWLQIYDRYVEEIGVQWTSGPSTLIDPGPGNRGGVVRRLDGWAFDGSTANQLPATSMSIVPGTEGSGLTLQSAMIGGTKLSALLTAVERNAAGRSLAAPEVTCLNGQQASCFFGNQIAYISDYEVVSSTYDPVITVLNVGVMLEVRPIVSADRKFVTLELRSASTTATLFTEFIVGVDINALAPAIYPIELPNVAIRTAGTTVMLPDRGSLLVGGFNASLDQFAATRVPLLGSIPFLGRLFGARGRYSEKSQLYLLTTATIINYPELEARL